MGLVALKENEDLVLVGLRIGFIFHAQAVAAETKLRG